MKILIVSLSTILILVSGLANAGQYEDAMAAYSKRQYGDAFKLLLPLAEQGSAKAQYNFAYMYEQGKGVKQDYKQAFNWYKKAAEQGLVNSEYQLGYMYYKGEGVTQDYVRAYMWNYLALAENHSKALRERELISAQITKQQVYEAKKLAKACEQSNFKHCG